MTHSPAAGLSLKPQHYSEALTTSAAGMWFEVHPENYMCEGGPRLAWLEAIREKHPLSLHGVGLSLAADEDPNPEHLAALRRLVQRFEPFIVSEHLAWSQRGAVYNPDLLPFPRTCEALDRVVGNVSRAQDFLGRQLLIENPSLYLAINGHEFSEVEFLAELAQRSGCGLLVDVNNVYVSSNNLEFDAEAYLDSVPARLIGEIHLAGHTADQNVGTKLLIDSHDQPIAEEVWAMYRRLVARVGAKPTLIERDDNIPQFSDLIAERNIAHEVLAGA